MATKQLHTKFDSFINESEKSNYSVEFTCSVVSKGIQSEKEINNLLEDSLEKQLFFKRLGKISNTSVKTNISYEANITNKNAKDGSRPMVQPLANKTYNSYVKIYYEEVTEDFLYYEKNAAYNRTWQELKIFDKFEQKIEDAVTPLINAVYRDADVSLRSEYTKLNHTSNDSDDTEYVDLLAQKNHNFKKDDIIWDYDTEGDALFFQIVSVDKENLELTKLTSKEVKGGMIPQGKESNKKYEATVIKFKDDLVVRIEDFRITNAILWDNKPV